MIAICVGHSRKGDNGAVSVSGVNEHAYNLRVAACIEAELHARDVPYEVFDHYEGEGYDSAMSWLAGRIKDIGAVAAIELHFNGAQASARGHEWLHWHTSTKGKALACLLDAEMQVSFPRTILPARGPKPRNKSHRGSGFLSKTHCPAVIGEPFFGSNATDWRLFATREKDVAAVYVRAITRFL